MRLQQLQCILEVSKQKSISAAARTLYMGQTTLSASIKKLEEELGVQIFQRNPDGVEITDEGRQVLQLAEEICVNYERVKNIGVKKSSGSLVTMHTSTGVSAFLPGMLMKELRERAPEMRVLFKKAYGPMISQRMINNECDIAVTYMGNTMQKYLDGLAEKYKIRVISLADDKLYLVVRKDHPLSDRKEMYVSEIKNMNIAGGHHFRTNVGSLVFEGHMGYTNRYTTFPSVDLMKQAVLEQNMAAIMTGFAFAFDNTIDSDELHPILLKDEEIKNESTLCLAYREVWAQTEEGKIVLSCVRSLYDKMEEKMGL